MGGSLRLPEHLWHRRRGIRHARRRARGLELLPALAALAHPQEAAPSRPVDQRQRARPAGPLHRVICAGSPQRREPGRRVRHGAGDRRRPLAPRRLAVPLRRPDALHVPRREADLPGEHARRAGGGKRRFAVRPAVRRRRVPALTARPFGRGSGQGQLRGLPGPGSVQLRGGDRRVAHLRRHALPRGRPVGGRSPGAARRGRERALCGVAVGGRGAGSGDLEGSRGPAAGGTAARRGRRHDRGHSHGSLGRSGDHGSSG